MRLLSSDLCSQVDMEESSIAVSISLAIHAKLQGRSAESRVHMAGLSRLLSLHPRGLKAILTQNPEMGNKIRRTDAEIALMTGLSTLLKYEPLPAVGHVLAQDVTDDLALPHPFMHASVVMQCAMRDALSLCLHVNNGVQLEAGSYPDIVLTLFQRLIDYAPLAGKRQQHSIDHLCQLGLLAFMTTIMYSNDSKRSIYVPLLAGKLQDQVVSLDENFADGTAEQYSRLHLWLVLMYSFMTPKTSLHENLVVREKVQLLAKALGMQSWEAANAHLVSFPWIDTVHQEAGRKVWVSCFHDLS